MIAFIPTARLTGRCFESRGKGRSGSSCSHRVVFGPLGFSPDYYLHFSAIAFGNDSIVADATSECLVAFPCPKGLTLPKFFHFAEDEIASSAFLTGGAGKAWGGKPQGESVIDLRARNSGRQPSRHTYRASESIPLHWPKR
jgi:hypothetical protein